MKQVITISLLFIFSACSDHQRQTNSDPAISSTSTTEKNKELIKRVYADMANKQNYSLIDSFFAPNIFDHGALEGQQQGREGFKKAVIEFLGMFSQVEITIKEIIAEGGYGCYQ
jgi:SnoaL-like polyketide cyclase